MSKTKSPWLPPLFVQTENTNWNEFGKGFSLTVIRNGVRTVGIELSANDADQVVALLKELGIYVEELKRGEPEQPRSVR